VWSLVGLDMQTGADAVNVPFYKEGGAKNFFANPFYAGVEVCSYIYIKHVYTLYSIS
jgi:hypothetical protein